MDIEIIMPKMGESITEGTILKWHKQAGERVTKDEVLFEISTDKVDTEIPAQADGLLTKILFHEGETVEVGTVLAILTVEEDCKNQDLTSPDLEEQSDPTSTKTVANTQEMNAVVEITMPKMGESLTEGTLLKWHKQVGEFVKQDELLFEISTDKVDTEVTSPAEGYLINIFVGEQETVAVGTVLAVISFNKENRDSRQVDEKEFSKGEKSMVVEEENIGDRGNKKNKFYSPLVINIAKKENIPFTELEKISGSGIEGRITKKDILFYIAARQKEAEKKKEDKLNGNIIQNTVSSGMQFQDTSQSETESVQMDNARKVIMQHMIHSRDTSVHVSETIEVDMSKVAEILKRKRDEFLAKDGIKLTYLPFIAAATVRALRDFPLINASISGNSIIKKKNVNLGIAVAVEPNGLMVPNIKNAQEKSLIGLAKAIVELGAKARNKKLTPDDITGGTFTITNYGVFGTLFGTPIINQPELAILGTGAVVKRPMVVELHGAEAIVIKPMMYVTLSHDHRLIDGMLGGKFLHHIVQQLENFDEKLFY